MINVFRQSQRLGYHLWNQRRIADRRQVDPREAIGKSVAEVVGELQCEPGLANPARPSHS